MKDVKNYKLTANVTVGQCKHWMGKKDDFSKDKMIELVHHRFYNRYLKHAKSADSGFLKMAIACLLIETIESFKQGLKNTKGKSSKMFQDFFHSEKRHFPGFDAIHKDFFDNVRCGILHQAETTNAWRILLDGPLLDLSEKQINADQFVQGLEYSMTEYIDRLREHHFTNKLWKNTLFKLEDICDNCEAKS